MADSGGFAAAPLSKSELCQGYADLLDSLNEGYWAAGTMADKDRIKGLMEATTDALTALNAADLTSRDASYSALCVQVKTVNEHLCQLQKEINRVISRITTAAEIADDIAKVLGAASKLFPGI